MSRHYCNCGAITATGNRCNNGVPSKGMRCGLHLAVKPERKEHVPTMPLCGGFTSQGMACMRRVASKTGLCVNHSHRTLLDEALVTAERVQADLTILTRTLKDMQRRAQ